MEVWFLILISLCVAALLNSILYLLYPHKKPSSPTLPPGPPTFPLIGNLHWLRKSITELESSLRSLHNKFGPVVTVRIGSRLAIFIADHSLAYQALIQDGAVYADRPPSLPVSKVNNSNQHNINGSGYGPNWRMLRRNLTVNLLHPSRVNSYSGARARALEILNNLLTAEAKSGKPVRVLDSFEYAMYCLLVIMCFGNEIEESQIKRIQEVQLDVMLNLRRFDILNLWPRLTRVIFRGLWEELLQLRKNLEDEVIPLIRSRQEMKNDFVCYVDTLFDLEYPEEKRKLDDGEMVSLCLEFLTAGTDTTYTTLQWIMANIVKYPEIQEKLFMEIKGVVGDSSEHVTEEDIEKMPYLRAVVLEGLRKHPPGHFLLPHAVSREMVLDKYVVPKNAVVNFMVAEMGRDPKVWEDPMAFKPERFVSSNGERFDVTGNRGIKMMPFGAGRRICPGYGLGMLHLEYFVANLVWKYEWKSGDGGDIDLSEKEQVTVVMKHPLQVHLSARFT